MNGPSPAGGPGRVTGRLGAAQRALAVRAGVARDDVTQVGYRGRLGNIALEIDAAQMEAGLVGAAHEIAHAGGGAVGNRLHRLDGADIAGTAAHVPFDFFVGGKAEIADAGNLADLDFVQRVIAAQQQQHERAVFGDDGHLVVGGRLDLAKERMARRIEILPPNPSPQSPFPHLRDQKDRRRQMPDLEATTGVGDAFDLSGRVAVLTGAASGIGRATAHVLAGAGATVVLGDIDEKGAQATADAIASRGDTALPLRTDVTKRADIDALVEGLREVQRLFAV